VCVNMCFEICVVCSNKHTVGLLYDKDGYVHSELRLEPKFREVGRGRGRFRFSSHEDPAISNCDDLIHYRKHCGTHKCLKSGFIQNNG
jgi:hypothetical protein